MGFRSEGSQLQWARSAVTPSTRMGKAGLGCQSEASSVSMPSMCMWRMAWGMAAAGLKLACDRLSAYMVFNPEAELHADRCHCFLRRRARPPDAFLMPGVHWSRIDEGAV
mmetsp:Transcript_601/g.1803  ORF Transcript_601/g.1803 Transcript_601/m.1803 type:complete len:110 (+) Transcript_601:91-420(+)